ncbi:MAG TPA: tRNA lysidine(34) synthetase TilS, partial [Candidatus Binatia bacterium]|nr:tRNA lysidine(34) synthetase TilS [Candidatus Binatia bacterium]
SLRRRTLRRAVWQLRRSLRDVSFSPIEQARLVAEEGQVGARSTLPGDLVLVLEYDTLLLHGSEWKRQVSAPQLLGEAVRTLPVPGSVRLDNGWQIQATYHERAKITASQRALDAWRECIDAEKAGRLTLRARRSGERMQPFGLQGHSAKIADIMINEKVPAYLRARWPIVANERHAVWIPGLVLDDRVRVNEKTHGVIQLRCSRVGA